MLSLPAHTTHILQPLDVGVFKSLKAHYSKACKQYLTANPGRVVTTDVIASLLGIAWPQLSHQWTWWVGSERVVCTHWPLGRSLTARLHHQRQYVLQKSFQDQRIACPLLVVLPPVPLEHKRDGTKHVMRKGAMYTMLNVGLGFYETIWICPTSFSFLVQASCSATEQTASEQSPSEGKHVCNKAYGEVVRYAAFVCNWNDPYSSSHKYCIAVCAGTDTSLSATS